MTLIDAKNLTDEGIVAQYVIELIGTGHFLSHEDYARLQKWRAKCASTDELLLIIDDVLPSRIEKSKVKGKKLFSLSSISKTVEKKIAERKMMLEGT